MAGDRAGEERPGLASTLFLATLLGVGAVVATLHRGALAPSQAAAHVHGRPAAGTLAARRTHAGEPRQAAGGAAEPPKSTAPPVPTTYLNNDKVIRGPITPSKFHVVQFGNAAGVAM